MFSAAKVAETVERARPLDGENRPATATHVQMR